MSFCPILDYHYKAISIQNDIMRKLLLLFFIFSSLHFVSAQESSEELQQRLHKTYDTYKEKSITHRRFKHAEIMSLLDKKHEAIRVVPVGKSVGEKEIKLISYGSGNTTVLLWSQMHGNEPTATMALMDIFNFLNSRNDDFDSFRQTLKSNLSVHFIPMLNPDGADKFVRRNDQGIDINRDALRQQTPEGRTLKRVRDSLDADWGFNLHDQGRTSYVADKAATISVLAPAYDQEKSVNEKRGNAMQLIALMNEVLQNYIPNQVSQYSDDFEPRAFGDNIQKWGTRTILVESGGLVNDRDKQRIRKLNFVSILMALHGIATDSYESFTTEDYFEIPRTNRGLRDVIIKNIQLPQSLGAYSTDIAFNFQEIENSARDDYFLRAVLVDIGDLSTSNGYLTYDVAGYTVKQGKIFDGSFESVGSLRKKDIHQLLQGGFTDFLVEEDPNIEDRNTIPAKFVKNATQLSELELGTNPSLLFYKEGLLKFVLINGYFFSPDKAWDMIIHGMKKL